MGAGKGKQAAQSEKLEAAFTKSQLESLIIYAGRYVIGRATYAPHEFIQIVTPHLSKLSSGTLACIDRDIKSYGEMFGYGMDIDKEAWFEFRKKVVFEILRRERGDDFDPRADEVEG